MKIRKLTPAVMPSIHKLLLACNFPQVPLRYKEARSYFEGVQHFGITKAPMGVAFWIGLFNKNGQYFVDIAAHPDVRGKWATRQNMADLYHFLFEETGADRIYGTSLTPAGIKLALAIGFDLDHNDAKQTNLVLSRETAKKWSKQNGQSIQAESARSTSAATSTRSSRF